MSLLHYSLNSRTGHETLEHDISMTAMAAARQIAKSNGGQIPGSSEFCVKLYRQGKNAIFTIDWMSVTPVMISALVADKAEEELIWIRLLKLVPIESGLHKLNPEPPEVTPWLAQVLLPKHVYATQHLEWLNEITLALGFVLLEETGITKEIGKS